MEDHKSPKVFYGALVLLVVFVIPVLIASLDQQLKKYIEVHSGRPVLLIKTEYPYGGAISGFHEGLDINWYAWRFSKWRIDYYDSGTTIQKNELKLAALICYLSGVDCTFTPDYKRNTGRYLEGDYYRIFVPAEKLKHFRFLINGG